MGRDPLCQRPLCVEPPARQSAHHLEPEAVYVGPGRLGWTVAIGGTVDGWKRRLGRVTPDREIVAIHPAEPIAAYAFEVHHRIRRDERDDYARTAHSLERCADVLGMMICAIFVWYGAKLIVDSAQLGSMVVKTLWIPEWWQYALIPVSFSLLAVEFARRLRA